MSNKSYQTVQQSNVSKPQQSGHFQSGFNQRNWLKIHGKQQCIDFTDKALIELRKYFNSLDEQQKGCIGVEELQDPFIAFGLSESREEVEQLVKSVDLDGSGVIQFDQFLKIMLLIKRGKSNSGNKNSAMYDFFKRMSTGQLGDDFDNDISFKLNVSQFRRKKLLDSIMSEQKEKKQKGAKILQNFKKQILNNPNLKQIFNQSKRGSTLMYGFDTKKKKPSK